jgi:SOS-response transcriptional repressor LexA
VTIATDLYLKTGTTMTDRKVLFAIVVLMGKRPGIAPTWREIGDECGMRSLATVQVHLDSLKLAGLITWVPKSPRTLTITEKGKQFV